VRNDIVAMARLPTPSLLEIIFLPLQMFTISAAG